MTTTQARSYTYGALETEREARCQQTLAEHKNVCRACESFVRKLRKHQEKVDVEYAVFREKLRKSAPTAFNELRIHFSTGLVYCGMFIVFRLHLVVTTNTGTLFSKTEYSAIP